MPVHVGIDPRMVYILTDQIEAEDAPIGAPMRRYRAYIKSLKRHLPRNVYDLALSDWYHSFNDHRCPHVARLETLTVEERCVGLRIVDRSVDLRIRLLGAYGDGHIEFRYQNVGSYRCELNPTKNDRGQGHYHWRYDEFRLSPNGKVLHEIEWYAQQSTGTWLIEAEGIEYAWLPTEPSP